ncbi:MAG TPA: hypothetical protein DEB39_12010 [Planctomycetaceae bacterium]|nr:hypothetical protein [Planctomycetaceae bacterium]
MAQPSSIRKFPVNPFARLWYPVVMVIALLFSLLFFGGCAAPKKVRLRGISGNDAFDRFRWVSPERLEISRRAQLTLRSYDLEKQLKTDPVGTLVRIREQIDREPTLDLIFSFAELSFLEANRQEGSNPRLALEMYVSSAIHAYGYLFDSRFENRRNNYDPHFREACLFYNGSLEKILRLMGRDQLVELTPGRTYALKTLDGSFNIRCVQRSGQWQGDDFEPFRFASDYEITGMQNEYRQYGLGVPLLGKRKADALPSPTTKYTPNGLSFPVTALLRFLPAERNSTVAAHSPTAGSGRRVVQTAAPDSNFPYGSAVPVHAVIELYDPLVTASTTIARQQVPLESDLTTPIAYSMSDSRIDEIRRLGFLRPEVFLLPTSSQPASILTGDTASAAAEEGVPGERVAGKTIKGLYMMQPYEQGKIPVIFVHGLTSSPLTWMEMFNSLRSEPVLCDRYQFFFYFYPTGLPFWVSAAQFRQDLVEFRRSFDPHRRDPVFEQLILVGHSMGGLISHLQTIDGGERFWQLASKVPLEELLADKSPQMRKEVHDWFYFRANPSIRRVISIATPYHGSDASNNLTQWFGRTAIKLPNGVRDVVVATLKGDDRLAEHSLLKVETSIDSFSPELAIYDVMEEARGKMREHSTDVSPVRYPPGVFSPPPVVYHNIVGEIELDVLSKRFFPPSDGVVKTQSARLEHAASEVVVPCEHMTVQAHPKTILEVRRILFEHLKSLGQSDNHPFRRSTTSRM